MKEMRRSLAVLLLVFLFARCLHSGGVLAVAGPIGFNPSVVGKPITWANASLSYYTDQGDLSILLPQSAANDFVADAFSRWTAVPSAALSVTRSGTLAEDVNGSNVFISGNTLTMPADVQPSATDKPLGVIYDQNGQVTDALLGLGAGAAIFCSTNSVFGGADSYTLDAHFAHALIVLNGNCAQQSADLPTLKYKLIRMAGRILGVGWSQLNDNVRTGTPAPSSEDLAGFPLMHPRGPLCNAPITECVPNPDQLRMDDRAAIAYLYPAVTTATARVHGSIYFSDERGLAGQPMQGVNVVARRIDPVTGTPSHLYAVASVSGFRFRGNNGNLVTGFQTALSEPYARFGSDDMALEGFFDLNGLEIPEGDTSASYQISVESLNPNYKSEAGVGAARYGVVAPSGSVTPIGIVNLTAGADVTRDIVVANSARIRRDATEPNPFTAPSQIPASGAWWASLSGYGDSDFFYFHARPGRTFHLRVTALDETSTSTAVKAQPTLGLWQAGAAPNSPPALLANAFNSNVTGQTKISAATGAESDLIVGIADFRGDGRPDYQYHARLLYADSVIPERIAPGSGPVVLQGYGFNGNTAVTMGGQTATVLARSGNRMLVQPPALGNGSVPVVLTDLGTGDASTITNGAQFGVVAGDQIVVLSSANPFVPVGADAPSPVRVRVTTADGTTPVLGANVNFSVTPVQSFFTACGANPCTIATDANGEAMAFVSVRATGENAVTASIANGAHAEGTVVGSSPSMAVFASSPSQRVPKGTTISIPISVRVLSSGNPVAGQGVNFSLGTSPNSGSATLSAASVVTNGAGDAANTVNVTAVGSSFTVLVCLSTGSPCTTVNIFAVQPTSLQLQIVRNGQQLLPFGQAAAPITLRVTDTANPTQPVRGMAVTLASSVFARLRSDDCNLQNTDCHAASVRPLATQSVTLVTDSNGLISYTPPVQSTWGAANIYMQFSVGSGTGQTQAAAVQVFK